MTDPTRTIHARRPRRYLKMIIFVMLLHHPGCKEASTTASATPTSVSGEVFLDGPDETRIKVSCSGAIVQEICNLLDSGVKAEDRKDQGAAALTIVYSNGKREDVEITDQALARRDGNPLQVNKQQIFNLLKQMVTDCGTE